MSFQNIGQLLTRFTELGAKRVFCKRLSENDNSKQQIYLGGSFEALSFFPHGEIKVYSELRLPNFKASLNLYWVSTETVEHAVGAQLILYPKYPEVRLSGFLIDCKTAPAEHLRQIQRENRCGIDGRVLIFGTTKDNRTLLFLAKANSSLATELLTKFIDTPPEGLFLEITLPVGSSKNREAVLTALRKIYAAGFHDSCRRNAQGKIIPYSALNGGGYTLEALLGITPNAKSEPDYLGWEIKGYSSNRITLMTPEPNGGFYGERGAKEFIEHYGHHVKDGGMYFTGGHKIGVPCVATGMTLKVVGFNPLHPKQFDVNGYIALVDSSGNEAASWDFAQLLTHWNRKHTFAAYIKYTSRKIPISYRYETPILMGEHTDFIRYLNALCAGAIVFDPGSKVNNAKTEKSTVKARSQFRINIRDLALLYEKLREENIS